MRKKLIFIVPLAILAFAAFIALGGLVVRQLWNWLLPTLFGLHTITFWQALGLLVLARILFGGLGWHGPRRSHVGHRMRERWHSMTPEERERCREEFRQRFRSKWGFPSSPGGETKTQA